MPTGHGSKMQIPPYVVWRSRRGEQHLPDAFLDSICSPIRKSTDDSDEGWQRRRNQYLWSTAVLVSHNVKATQINHRLLDDLLPDGERFTFLSSNENEK